MENRNKQFSGDLKTAFVYAISFVLAVAAYRISRSESVPAIWKLAAATAYGLWMISLFKVNQLISFAGFCMLMVGLNYVWQEENLPVAFKVLAVLVVLGQLGTLGNNKKEGIFP